MDVRVVFLGALRARGYAATGAGQPRRIVAHWKRRRMKVLTVYPEHAELFRLGIRRIETRSWKTNYRGPLYLHASRRDPDCAAARRSPRSQAALAAIPHGDPLTQGAITVRCELVGVVPIVTDGSQGHQDAGFRSYVLVLHDGTLRLCDWSEIGWGDGHWAYGARQVEIDDQRPFGLFEPSRYAWLLSDIVPVDPPIPAKGRQGLWEWTDPRAVRDEVAAEGAEEGQP